jgi:hypothetical protein
MGISSRRKGNRIELDTLHKLQDAGIVAEKLSYAYKKTHDINVVMFDRKKKMEIKCRANGFTTIYKWLEPVDLLVLRRDRSEPLVVMSLNTLIEMINGPRRT